MAHSAQSRRRRVAVGSVVLVTLCVVARVTAATGSDPVTAPYGSWSSPLTAEALAAAQVGFDNLRSANGRLYWTETVPDAGGIPSLFSMTGDAGAARVTPEGVNVRTRVHEYGGAPYVVAGGVVYYSQLADQRLYALKGAGSPVPLTPVGYRYADCTPTPASAAVNGLVCVREDHTDAAHVRNALVRVALPGGGGGEVLYGDSDFVAYPRFSRDGRRLAFITWNHPHMPWDSSELKVAQFDGQHLGTPTTIAGGEAEAVLDPQWAADGTLYFVSDRSGYWNLYAHSAAGVRAVWARADEFAKPLLTLGQANYALLGENRAVARFGEQGLDRLAVIDLKHGGGHVLDLPYVEYSQLTRLDARHVVALAGSATGPQSIVRIDIVSGDVKSLRIAGHTLLAPASVSRATSIDFPSANGRVAHAFYYAPANAEFQGPKGSLPPLLTLVHGGPTWQASPAYSSKVQFWTSRGFAVVDVNFGGSSGFGRRYRQELNGNWGVIDVEDVIAAARFLGRDGHVDPARMAISGGSAGGYTVLVALSMSDVFRAGADYFGISDMTALARDTHKFESHYMDTLIGPLPQAQAIYDSRSPLNHLDGFKVPLIVFQGADDPVVPPNQSGRIVEALRAHRAPVAYLVYDGEGHGFRNPKNVIRCLQAELSFYGQVFGFKPADKLPALTIENLASNQR